LLDDGKLDEVQNLYGQDANSVLLSVMNTDIRNADIDKKLKDVLDAIQEMKLELAETLISELEEELSADNIELTKARILLKKQELRHAKNS
jgi:hypothetical protein